ncbi:MAG: hypothetical protein HC811_02290 [Flammeovirgaceae bacterium]|nr:hypothetical protein [Flammeovirgaceae bacterium]
MPDTWVPAFNGKAVGLEDLEAVARELIKKAGNVRLISFLVRWARVKPH